MTPEQQERLRSEVGIVTEAAAKLIASLRDKKYQLGYGIGYLEAMKECGVITEEVKQALALKLTLTAKLS